MSLPITAVEVEAPVLGTTAGLYKFTPPVKFMSLRNRDLGSDVPVNAYSSLDQRTADGLPTLTKSDFYVPEKQNPMGLASAFGVLDGSVEYLGVYFALGDNPTKMIMQGK